MKGPEAVLASWPLGPGKEVHPVDDQEDVTGNLFSYPSCGSSQTWTAFLTLH